jgi:predicted RNase H-like HicB family nuclease
VPLTRFVEAGLRKRGVCMEVEVILYTDEDGMWIAECPAIPGCVSQGRTEAEALANIREAAAACLEVRRALGLPLTVKTVRLQVPAA